MAVGRCRCELGGPRRGRADRHRPPARWSRRRRPARRRRSTPRWRNAPPRTGCSRRRPPGPSRGGRARGSASASRSTPADDDPRPLCSPARRRAAAGAARGRGALPRDRSGSSSPRREACARRRSSCPTCSIMRRREHHRLVGELAGPLGLWLAEREPRWAFVRGAVDDVDAVWASGGRQARRALLERLRRTDPAAGPRAAGGHVRRGDLGGPRGVRRRRSRSACQTRTSRSWRRRSTTRASPCGSRCRRGAAGRAAALAATPRGWRSARRRCCASRTAARRRRSPARRTLRCERDGIGTGGRRVGAPGARCSRRRRSTTWPLDLVALPVGDDLAPAVHAGWARGGEGASATPSGPVRCGRSARSRTARGPAARRSRGARGGRRGPVRAPRSSCPGRGDRSCRARCSRRSRRRVIRAVARRRLPARSGARAGGRTAARPRPPRRRTSSATCSPSGLPCCGSCRDRRDATPPAPRRAALRRRAAGAWSASTTGRSRRSGACSPWAVVTYVLGDGEADHAEVRRAPTARRARGRDARHRPRAAAARRARHRQDVAVRAPGGGDQRRQHADRAGHRGHAGGGAALRLELRAAARRRARRETRSSPARCSGRWSRVGSPASRS